MNRQSFLFLILFLSIELNCDVIIKDAEYNSCNIFDTTTFNLIFERTENSTAEFSGIDIQMVSEAGEEVVKCVPVEETSKLACSFTPLNETIYHPALSEDTPIGEEGEVIKAFELTSVEIGFSSKEYVRPSHTSYEKTIYEHDEVTSYYIQYEFEGNLAEDTLPTVKYNDIDKNTPCEVYSEDSTKMSCEYDVLNDFTLRDTEYLGKIINVCGTKDADLSLLIIKKADTTLLNLTKIQDGTPQLTCTKEMPNGTEIVMEYSYLGAAVVDGPYDLEDAIKFRSVDESAQFKAKCSLDSEVIKCETLEEVPQNGNYYAVVDEEFLITRDAGDYKLEKGKTENTLKINENYVPFETKELDPIEYDYKDGESSSFTITFTDILNEPTAVKINDIALECTVDGNKQICTFTKEQFPVREGEESSTYSGEVLNHCGEHQFNLTLIVKETEIPLIEIKITDFADATPQLKCTKELTIGTEISIKYAIESSVEGGPYDLENAIKFRFEKDDTIEFKAKCSLDSEVIKCETLEVVPQNGNYYAIVDEEVIIPSEEVNYKLVKGKTEKTLKINENYVPFEAKELAPIEYNYRKGDSSSFALIFTETVTEPTEVTLNETSLNCTVDGNKQICPFTKEQFPVLEGEEETTYSGEVLDHCGEHHFDLTLIVKDSLGSFIAIAKFIILLGILILL